MMEVEIGKFLWTPLSAKIRLARLVSNETTATMLGQSVRFGLDLDFCAMITAMQATVLV